MSESITELKNRLKTAQDKFDLLKLREDITTLMDSPRFQELSQSDKNRIEDLLVEAIAKEEQYKGCDPWKTILEH
jgi:cation transport regulator ChaC